MLPAKAHVPGLPVYVGLAPSFSMSLRCFFSRLFRFSLSSITLFYFDIVCIDVYKQPMTSKEIIKRLENEGWFCVGGKGHQNTNTRRKLVM